MWLWTASRSHLQSNSPNCTAIPWSIGVLEEWSIEINELQILEMVLKVQTPIPDQLVFRRRRMLQFELSSSTPCLQSSTTPSSYGITVT